MTLDPNENPLLNRQNPEPNLYLQPAAAPASQPEPALENTSEPMAVSADVSSEPTIAATAPASVYMPKPAEKKPDNDAASIKDTIESIIIALIFALTFRAFLVEAFVIPTASMAPTLLGAHARVICPKCGLDFDENVDLRNYYDRARDTYPLNTSRDLRDSTAFPLERQFRRCPNCGYRIHGTELPEYLSKDLTHDPARYFAWTNNGDRILVMKYLYSVSNPQRWDVIVFKEPQAAKDNYIKRLIGLPGETVEIIGGNIFIGEPGATQGAPKHIARKPDFVQNAVWQLIYDNDHYPVDADKPRRTGDLDFENKLIEDISAAWRTPWRGEANDAGWSTHSPIVSYDGTAASSLSFDLTGQNANSAFYFRNIAGYNNDIDENDHVTVSDLHLEASWTPRAAGPVSITLGREINRFRAGINADGSLSLERYQNTQKSWSAVPLSTPDVTRLSSIGPVVAGRTYQLAMNNVDHRIQLWVDGRCVLQYDPEWNDGDQRLLERQATLEGGVPQALIDVSGACVLTHLKLMRDLYYTDRVNNTVGRGTMGQPETLASDEYFALGDNSTKSADSRFWNDVDMSLYDLPVWREYKLGHIPKRYLLGRAFFVYWPAGYRPIDSVPLPLVPDAGHMRMIR